MTAPIAQTNSGPIRGFLDGEVYAFKGIPYGRAERFMAPTPPAPWSDPCDCLEYGPTSPQPARLVASISGAPPAAQGEDCLVLNVWSRGLADGGKRPVMFWIHGGGFNTGSGSSPVYDGANLARRGDVVAMSVNHRLGAPGHLYLRELGGERYATSGINSFLDLILALQWVRDNAESFGGDPENVMIFGESGGGGKVCTLLAMPAARGLFNKVAIQSGIKVNNDRGIRAIFGKHGLLPEEGTAFARDLLSRLGLAEGDVARLEDLPIDQIEEAQGAVERTGQVMAPVIDGHHLPCHPFDPAPAPTAIDVPMLIGANGDEWFNYISTRPEFTGIDWPGVVKWTAGWSLGEETAERIVGAYRQHYPEASPEDLLTTICSDHMIRVPTVRVTDLRSQPGMGPVYAYLFTWDSPLNGKSVHALEIPFVFDNVDKSAPTGTGTERYPLASRMSDAWIAFARSGNPNHEGLAEWPLYDPEQRRVMVFDLETRVERDPFGADARIWDGVI